MSTIEDDAGTRLAERLKLEREAHGWSLADLAERSGVSRGAISKIERGESSPTAGLLVRLAEARGRGGSAVACRRPAALARPGQRLSAPAGIRARRPSGGAGASRTSGR